MLISDVMKTNVISIPSTTTLADARRIMEAHKIKRLPVIDKLRLVGIVSKDDLDRVGPSQLTTFSMNEIAYMLNKITVKEVMHRDVITVSPDTPLEEAIYLAQCRGVGSVLVTEGDRVVGIATASDTIIRFLNPLFAMRKPGIRLLIKNCFKVHDIEKILKEIDALNLNVINMFITDFPEVGKHDLILHLDTGDVRVLSEAITKLGFSFDLRERPVEDPLTKQKIHNR